MQSELLTASLNKHWLDTAGYCAWLFLYLFRLPPSLPIYSLLFLCFLLHFFFCLVSPVSFYSRYQFIWRPDKLPWPISLHVLLLIWGFKAWPQKTLKASAGLQFKLDCSVCTCLTQLYDGRYMHRIYYIKNSYMFRHFTTAIFRLRNEKKLSKQLYSTYVGCMQWGLQFLWIRSTLMCVCISRSIIGSHWQCMLIEQEAILAKGS